MIELAPNHKIGLPVDNPILLAGGAIGYGEAVLPGLALSKLGAVTVGPLLMHSRAGAPTPRRQEVEGGFILDTGLQNRGLDATLRKFAKLWRRLGCPVLVQVAESNPRDVSKIVEQLEAVNGVAGIELLLPAEIDRRAVKNLLRAASENCDLPILTKLPLDRAVELAEICVQCEAAGLVVGSAYHSMGSEAVDSEAVDSEAVDSEASDLKEVRVGSLYGPIVFPKMLAALQAVSQLKLDCSLIACGGIYTIDHVRQALDCGAKAVQIDSAVWAEPGLPERLLNGK